MNSAEFDLVEIFFLAGGYFKDLETSIMQELSMSVLAFWMDVRGGCMPRQEGLQALGCVRPLQDFLPVGKAMEFAYTFIGVFLVLSCWDS